MRFCPNCRKPSLDSRKRAQMRCKFRLSVPEKKVLPEPFGDSTSSLLRRFRLRPASFSNFIGPLDQKTEFAARWGCWNAYLVAIASPVGRLYLGSSWARVMWLMVAMPNMQRQTLNLLAQYQMVSILWQRLH
jgi:hypothetical protein